MNLVFPRNIFSTASLTVLRAFHSMWKEHRRRNVLNSFMGFVSDSDYKPFHCYDQSTPRCAFSSDYQRGVPFDRLVASSNRTHRYAPEKLKSVNTCIAQSWRIWTYRVS